MVDGRDANNCKQGHARPRICKSEGLTLANDFSVEISFKCGCKIFLWNLYIEPGTAD